MHTTLAQIICEESITTQMLDAETKRYRKTMSDLQNWSNELKRQKTLIMNGLDMSKISLAEHVLYINGEFGKGEDESIVNAAIMELAQNKGRQFFKNYVGTKDYDRFVHQSLGFTNYGCSPRHGYVVFEIGLQQPLRDSPRDLTDDEIDASIYLLEMLKLKKWINKV